MIAKQNTERAVPRRVLLFTSMGLGGLGLVACGGGSNTNSKTPQNSDSMTPSILGEASASSNDKRLTATPDPHFSKGYSGGQKASEGEYHPADTLGPAQNVPKPAMPEDGYKLATVEGLEKSMHAWVNWRNYGVETGDYTVARQFISQNFSEEIEYMNEKEGLYKRGGWVVDGITIFEFHGDPYIKDDGVYQWEFYRLWKRVMSIEPNGRFKEEKNSRNTSNTFWLEAKNDGNGWNIITTYPAK